MIVQINKEGRERYKRKYFFPDVKERCIFDGVLFEDGSYWSKFIVAELHFNATIITFRCPNCGLQMYGFWYHDEEFIAKGNDGQSDIRYNYSLYRHSITFGDLWYRADQEQKAYSETSKRIEAEMRAVRAMKTCPVCGEALSDKTDYTWKNRMSEFDNDDIKSDFSPHSWECMVDDSVLALIPGAKQAIQNIENAALCQDVDIDKSKLAGNPDLLQKYIKHLLNTEMTVRLLKERIDKLYSSAEEYRFQAIWQQGEELSEIAGAHYAKIDLKEPTLDDIVLGEAEPVEPHFTEKPPTEPQYRSPGLFNKKKVLAENEKLRADYLATCQGYQNKKAEYDKQLDKYRAALISYKNRKQEAFTRRLNEHKSKVSTERATFLAALDCRKTEIMEHLGSYLLYQETLKEIRHTEDLYAESYACLHSLYSCGVVYEKYRNPVALASFYDYLVSGRCTTLTGADGAYNIYENEVRLDRIVTKLDVVIKKLNQIKDAQYALYSAMCEMNANLNALNSTATAMEDSLKTIKSHQKKISENTAVISHNTAVTAFYAKKNAELTNALGFMVALK